MRFLTDSVSLFSNFFAVQLIKQPKFSMNLFFDFKEVQTFCNGTNSCVDPQILTPILASLVIFSVGSMRVSEVKKFPGFPRSISPFLDDEEVLADYLLSDISFIDELIEEHCDKIANLECKPLAEISKDVKKIFNNSLNFIDSKNLPEVNASAMLFIFPNYAQLNWTKKPHFFAMKIFYTLFIFLAVAALFIFVIKHFKFFYTNKY